MNFHETVNTFEAILWTVIGCVFLWLTIRPTKAIPRNRSWIAAMAFLTFGLSDVMEIATGAWWRPWWLFLMKAACVVILVGLYFEYAFRRKRTLSPQR